MLLSLDYILGSRPEAGSRQPRKPAFVRARKPRKLMRIRASELNNKVKVRPRIQRAFFTWLIQNWHRLAFDLLIEGRTDHFINFSFIGVNRAISAALTTYEINVSVEWNDECWDLLLSLESSPRRGRTGYFCKCCLDYFRETNPGEEFTRIFPSREAVWVNDIFEPFLNWVNDDLANAKWLGLFGTPGSATWAKLMDASPDGDHTKDLAALLPCREG